MVVVLLRVGAVGMAMGGGAVGMAVVCFLGVVSDAADKALVISAGVEVQQQDPLPFVSSKIYF